MQNDAADMQTSMAIPQKSYHGITVGASNSTSGYRSKIILDKDSSQLYSQEPKGGGNLSVCQQINGQNICLMHTMEYISALKRKVTLTHAKGNKPDIRVHILYDSFYLIYLKESNS